MKVMEDINGYHYCIRGLQQAQNCLPYYAVN